MLVPKILASSTNFNLFTMCHISSLILSIAPKELFVLFDGAYTEFLCSQGCFMDHLIADKSYHFTLMLILVIHFLSIAICFVACCIKHKVIVGPMSFCVFFHLNLVFDII